VKLSLQLATDSDIPAIVTLMNAAFRGIEAELGWSTEAGYITGARTNETLIYEEIAEGAHFLLLHDPQTAALQGCVSLKALSSEVWYLGSLTVDPALQNSGFGRMLLSAAEDYAFARGARTIEMTVVGIRDTLIAWYERRGYARTGEVRPFPYGDDRFGTPMRDDLDFVVFRKSLASTSSIVQ
jgi:ribosomal protein S18 acetylase RimI-like enzyme